MWSPVQAVQCWISCMRWSVLDNRWCHEHTHRNMLELTKKTTFHRSTTSSQHTSLVCLHVMPFNAINKYKSHNKFQSTTQTTGFVLLNLHFIFCSFFVCDLLECTKYEFYFIINWWYIKESFTIHDPSKWHVQKKNNQIMQTLKISQYKIDFNCGYGLTWDRGLRIFPYQFIIIFFNLFFFVDNRQIKLLANWLI